MKQVGLFVLIMTWAVTAYGLTGSGTQTTPYGIASLEDFDLIAGNPDYWNDYIRLDTDINLTGRSYDKAVIAWDPESTSGFQGTSFTGTFDGNGYVIRNLTCLDSPLAAFMGLFGRIHGGIIQNLGMENVSIGGYEHIGGLCGYNDEGTITNCYATGTVTGDGNLGGLCGDNSGTITDCYTTTTVTGDYWSSSLGGLCGDNSGMIIGCYATGAITGDLNKSSCLGGLCGFNYGIITTCYATGTVKGDSALGGLCGGNGNWEFPEGTITDCYSTGTVIGNSYVGGLCGGNFGDAITNGYFYLLSGPDNHQGTPLTKTQLGDVESFHGFDFIGNVADGTQDDWAMVPGHCPKLSWQVDDGPLLPTAPMTTLTGSGYADDPFQINNLVDFNEFAGNSSLNSGYYILTTDIDLAGQSYTTAVINRGFGGYFDGKNHIISNLNIDSTDADTEEEYLGLFSCLTASVSNLGIENIIIKGGYYSGGHGGLCGMNYYGTVTNCYTTGTVTGSYGLGGLCGNNHYGTITACYATGVVTGNQSLGGLCGGNSGTITDCYATVTVTSNNDNSFGDLGGLCGGNAGTITNCYATGVVTGTEGLGGLCGSNYGTITDCYATGDIASEANSYNLGGLCGYNSSYCNDGTITDCNATGDITGGTNSYYLGGLCGYNSSTITNCNTTGNVTSGANSNYLGGLCGSNGSWENNEEYDTPGGPITNCSAAGAVTGGDDSESLGGLCGFNFEGAIADCSAIGAVTGGVNSINLGGLCGSNTITPMSNHDSPITACYATGNVNGQGAYNIGGLCGSNGYDGHYFGKSITVPGGTITDCHASGVISGGAFGGGLCGFNYKGTINNSYATGALVSGGGLGGLCGMNYYGTITTCYATGELTGGSGLGGLCSENNYGQITDCYATGSLTGNSYLGGLCADNRGTITACYATGAVTGGTESECIGGLCGINEEVEVEEDEVVGFSGGRITSCYATGSVTGNIFLGGLCGWNFGGITGCYSIGKVTGNGEGQYIGAMCGINDSDKVTDCYFYLFSGPDNHIGRPLATVELTDAGSFLGFDFVGNLEDGTQDEWDITPGHCPQLSWQTDDGPLPPVYIPVTTLTGSGSLDDPFEINRV